jgi:hypothetical protein
MVVQEFRSSGVQERGTRTVERCLACEAEEFGSVPSCGSGTRPTLRPCGLFRIVCVYLRLMIFKGTRCGDARIFRARARFETNFSLCSEYVRKF